MERKNGGGETIWTIKRAFFSLGFRLLSLSLRFPTLSVRRHLPRIRPTPLVPVTLSYYKARDSNVQYANMRIQYANIRHFGKYFPNKNVRMKKKTVAANSISTAADGHVNPCVWKQFSLSFSENQHGKKNNKRETYKKCTQKLKCKKEIYGSKIVFVFTRTRACVCMCVCGNQRNFCLHLNWRWCFAVCRLFMSFKENQRCCYNCFYFLILNCSLSVLINFRIKIIFLYYLRSTLLFKKYKSNFVHLIKFHFWYVFSKQN